MMPTELETQAAEAKCPIRQDSWDDIGGTHPPVCQCAEPGKAYGSGLRWPPLSRACPGPADATKGFCKQDADCQCHSSGCVPDVTLEKVWPLLNDATGRHVIHIWLGIDDLWHIWPVVADKRFIGDTPLEAALAALLNSKTPATPAQTEPAPE